MRDIADLRLSNILLAVDDEGIARVTLNRPAKRNALDLATIEELIDIFTTLPRAGVRAAILDAAGDHFCAGLDLVEHHREDRSAADFMQVCLRWHDAFNRMEYGGVPVIAVLQGADAEVALELGAGLDGGAAADLAQQARLFQVVQVAMDGHLADRETGRQIVQVHGARRDQQIHDRLSAFLAFHPNPPLVRRFHNMIRAHNNTDFVTL